MQFFIPLVMLLIGLTGSTCAQKYNLTKYVEAQLVASYDWPGADCLVPGICYPVNQTVPKQSLWYWCGFKATHRTTYKVTAYNTDVNLTTMYLMRRSQLEGCAKPNVTWVGDRCQSIPESSCSGKKSCDVRVFGLVFPDEMCFVMINKDKKQDIIASVQLQNFYDRPRYYGTCFVLLFTVVGGLAILANVSWQFYVIIIAPVGRHTEPVKVKREGAFHDAEKAAVVATVPNGPIAVQSARQSWYNKLVSKLRSHTASAHQS